MAHVHLAVSQGPAGFSKLVVLKMLRKDLANVEDIRAGFLREARICARMNHPNVVAVNEVDVVDGLPPVIVMEYLQGQALSSVLRRVLDKAPFDLHLRVMMEALSGLHYTHELTDFDGAPLRLVHRDFTPQNIFITYEGSIKVLDFGIAQVTRDTSHPASNTVQGKLRYMAPEQTSSVPLDRRTDIFAAGVLLCELITGQRFWGDLSETEVIKRLRAGDIPTPRRFLPNCPIELEHICATALAFNRNDRYATVAAMQRDLAAYMAKRPQQFTSQDVGRRVAEWFATERECAQQIIESSLSNDNYVSWSRIATVASLEVTRRSIPPMSGTVTVRELPDSSFATTPEPSRPQARPRKLAAIFGISLFTVGVVLLILRKEPPRSTLATPGVASSSTVSMPVLESKSGELTSRANIRITAYPPNAFISIDGIETLENPLLRDVTPDDTWHLIRVEAPGYETSEQRIQFTHNTELVISLRSSFTAAREPTGIGGRAAVQPPGSTTRTKEPSCSPPYTYDQRGVKHFKPECL